MAKSFFSTKAALVALVLLFPSFVSSFCKTGAWKQLFSDAKISRSRLYGAPMGPIARAKKMADPADYDRVVRQKMKQTGMTREEAEEEYNNFLENPPFYYALDQKKKRYQELGYKDLFEGMIGEAEKEGRGDEVRKQIEDFQRTSKLKAYSVLLVAIGSFVYFRTMYQADPENFLPGI